MNMDFLAQNWVTILLTAALAALVAWVIYGMIRDKKSGKSSCAGDCSFCGSQCHSSQPSKSGKTRK